MKIFTAAQIQAWDKYTIKKQRITAVDLMERAATACFKWIDKNILASNKIIVCCGTGNNGGDGLVVARLLHKAEYKVAIYILDSKKTSKEYTINLLLSL